MSALCSCGNAGTLGSGGGAIRLNASYAEVNGTLVVDGQFGGSVGGCSFTNGGGSGGSIWLSLGTLGYSTGLLSAKGGMGSHSASTPSQSGAGGSGGRISVVSSAHMYASDAWSDFKLRFSNTGGYNGYRMSLPTYANIGAPGTTYIDVGSRNRSILIDNGDALTNPATVYAMVPDQVNAFNFREIRVLRSGHLKFPALISATGNSIASVNVLTGDATGMVSIQNRTTLLIAASQVPTASSVQQSDTPLSASTFVYNASSNWQVSYTRSYVVMDSTMSFAGVSMLTDLGSTLVVPPTIYLNTTTLDVYGALGSPTSVTMYNGAWWYMRAGSSFLGTVGNTYSMASIYMNINCILSFLPSYTYAITNLTATTGNKVYFGVTTLALNPIVVAPTFSLQDNAILLLVRAEPHTFSIAPAGPSGFSLCSMR